jgi:4-hydroxybenzoate polyprenyltransferase
LRTFHFLRLVRPANIVTSIADVLAGIAIAGFFTQPNLQSANWLSVFLLCLSTACLYGGGIVFNDVFDAELDKLERPERPIPSGLVGLKQAKALGSILLLAGIVLAFAVNLAAGILAFLIAVLALLYDKYSKHHTYIGPFNMGLCRGLNLLLGISIFNSALENWYLLAIIPILYIFSITLISQGEVHGGGKAKLFTAALLYTFVAGSIVVISVINQQALQTVLLVVPFLTMIFRPLINAIRQPTGKNIGRAVKAGVISLILMDAAWAACFFSLYAGLFIACLLPISIWLGKRFAVT